MPGSRVRVPPLLFEREVEKRAAHSSVATRGPGVVLGMVSIAEPPPETDARALPGHWKRDFLVGKADMQIITSVDRASRLALRHARPGLGRRLGHGGPRADTADRAPPRRAPALAHVGPGQGDGAAPAIDRRHRGPGLLQRPAEPVTARLEREHQRAATAVLSDRNGRQHGHATAPRRPRTPAQHASAPNAPVANTRSSPRGQSCNDRLRHLSLSTFAMPGASGCVPLRGGSVEIVHTHGNGHLIVVAAERGQIRSVIAQLGT
ncbi:hypothetical protein BH09GEM1_BH09GEM1_45410 [soil metagenome]